MPAIHDSVIIDDFIDKKYMFDTDFDIDNPAITLSSLFASPKILFVTDHLKRFMIL